MPETSQRHLAAVLFAHIAGYTALLLALAACTSSPKDTDWPSYLGDDARSHFSQLDQINTSNVANLKVAWTYRSGGADTVKNTTQIQHNPLIINGILYGASPDVGIFALDAATGQERWKFKTFEWLGGENSWAGVCRGLAHWTDGKEQRLFYSAGAFLVALDAATGQPITTFGDSGRVDMRRDLDYHKKDFFIVNTSPGVVYKDLLILGMRVTEGADAAPGHIRAYDVLTGERRWIFHTIPHPGEYGYETWQDADAWQRIGGANCWSGMALDKERGIVFVPTGSAAFDFWGGNRKGQNLFSDCLLALDANTGKRLWHFQTTHHDLWDRDPPCPPVLLTVHRFGKKIDAVAQPTKQGLVFLFDRETGQPLFRIDERPAPFWGSMPGEELWPTQPFPVKPAPFARQSMTEADLNPYSEQRDSLRAIFSVLQKEIYSPPSRVGSLVLPGFDGGAEWGGAAADPEGILYVNSSEMPWVLRMVDLPKSDGSQIGQGEKLYATHCTGCHGLNRQGNGVNPNLLNIKERRTEQFLGQIIRQGKGAMASFGHLSNEDRAAIVAYLMDKKPAAGSDKHAVEQEAGIPFTHTGYIRLQDKNRQPAINPPWGTLNAIDLNTGEYLWKIPLGEDPDLKKKGIRNTGTENYGGPAVTAGGLVFIAASKDEKIRAFDRENGRLLWEADLPACGFATPSVYSVGGKQYVVVACGGGKLGRRSGDAYVAFAL
ncbi:MAG TPA: PQQ-binding-like beta-propeller repeat protein [Saprospiraceae bacterium]|nr:PQQ-binding-like beta-propeller repeat protein [Saprospiraceae bacterium]